MAKSILPCSGRLAIRGKVDIDLSCARQVKSSVVLVRMFPSSWAAEDETSGQTSCFDSATSKKGVVHVRLSHRPNAISWKPDSNALCTFPTSRRSSRHHPQNRALLSNHLLFASPTLSSSLRNVEPTSRPPILRLREAWALTQPRRISLDDTPAAS
jgi:hypothetical protein